MSNEILNSPPNGRLNKLPDGVYPGVLDRISDQSDRLGAIESRLGIVHHCLDSKASERDVRHLVYVVAVLCFLVGFCFWRVL